MNMFILTIQRKSSKENTSVGRDEGTWGPKGALAPAGSTKKKVRVGIKK